MPFWLIKGVIFFQKLKISKIWNRNFVAGPMKSLSTKNQLILTIPLWLLFFSGEKGGPISQRENRKKSTFFGRKSANFRNFSKIIRNLIKHIEIHIWSKFQLNWTFFRQIMAISNSNFVLLYIYSKTSLRRTSSGNEKVSVLERWPSYRGHFALKQPVWDQKKCPSYRGVRLMRCPS